MNSEKNARLCNAPCISRFLPEHSFMLKTYQVVVETHVILVSAQVLWVLTLDFGLGLDNKIIKTIQLALVWNYPDVFHVPTVYSTQAPEGLNNVSRFLALIFLARKVVLQENSFILVLLIDIKTVIVFLRLKILGGWTEFSEKTENNILYGAWVINQKPQEFHSVILQNIFTRNLNN